MESARPIVTASFDDGHSLDMKVAERLAGRGILATFYVAWNHPKEPEISAADLRCLQKMGMEIGSHTWSHRLLTGRPKAEVVEELTKSKKALEDLLGSPVTSFSYPEGRFNGMIRAAVAECGYRLARTTIAYRTNARFDPLRMPVTVMLLPLSRYEHVRHGIRDGNLAGLGGARPARIAISSASRSSSSIPCSRRAACSTSTGGRGRSSSSGCGRRSTTSSTTSRAGRRSCTSRTAESRTVRASRPSRSRAAPAAGAS
jgi:hypothetical protein